MIPLVRRALADAEQPYVTRLWRDRLNAPARQAYAIRADEEGGEIFCGPHGLLAIEGGGIDELDGDVVLVDPRVGRAERLLRQDSTTNTLLVTERCDQLCVMCSQPPKKTHHDRFDLLEQACLIAPEGMLIGVSGGEPTLYKDRLLTMIERSLAARPDLKFHVLSNGQHFEQADIERLRNTAYRSVSWGIPVYAADPELHDQIVGKAGAFDRLEQSLAHLAMAASRIELRTVLLADNVAALPTLAKYLTTRLGFVEAWSIMQLEHIGFARGRWASLFVDHRRHFGPIAEAVNHALLHGLRAQLFNFPRCTVPREYRELAMPSISDWKRKYIAECAPCREQSSCSGFFEWHPDEEARMAVSPL